MVDEIVRMFVNNSLDEFRNWLKENLASDKKNKKEQDKVQLDLLGVLQEDSGIKLLYDGEKNNAKYLMETLEPFSDKHVGFMIDAGFKRLYSLLPLLSILEEGGVEGVNAHIEKLFAEYKEIGAGLSEKAMREKIMAINDLLLGVIYLFPHLVNGVEVKLLPHNVIEAEKFMDRYGYDYGKDRRIYDAFRKAEPCKSETLTLPLPYGFTTGTHGSGERSARGASREEIYLTYIHPRNNWGIRIPAIALAINRPLVYLDHIYFTLDEVEHIKLSKNSEFTPFCDEDHEGVRIIPKINHVLHYLIFRGFANYVNFREREDFKDVSDEDWIFMRDNLFEPDFGSGLWEEKWGIIGKDRLEKGFLAVKFRDAENMLLMEFNNVKLPSENRNIAARKLNIMILQNDKKMQKTVKKYKGNEAIKRLFQIPVKERHF